MKGKRSISLVRVAIYSLLVLDLLLYFGIATKNLPALHGVHSLVSRDFSFVSWQVTASLSALSIALISLLQTRIDELYFGLSVREVLFLSKPKIGLGANYWELIVIIISLNAVMGIHLALELYVQSVLGQLYVLLLLMQVMHDSIGVLTQEHRFQSAANAYSDLLLKSTTPERWEEAKAHLLQLGHDAKLRMQNGAYPKDNITLSYLMDLLTALYREHSSAENPETQSTDEAELSAQVLNAISIVYERALDTQNHKYAKHLVEYSVFGLAQYSRKSYNYLTLRTYYRSSLPFEYLAPVVLGITSFAGIKEELMDDLLPFVRAAIDLNWSAPSLCANQ